MEKAWSGHYKIDPSSASYRPADTHDESQLEKKIEEVFL